MVMIAFYSTISMSLIPLVIYHSLSVFIKQNYCDFYITCQANIVCHQWHRYHKVISLKNVSAGLKIMLGVGGWNVGSMPFTRMVSTEGNRREFAYNSADFLAMYGFDGLELDWEYPTARGSPAVDKQRFAELVKVSKHAIIFLVVCCFICVLLKYWCFTANVFFAQSVSMLAVPLQKECNIKN